MESPIRVRLFYCDSMQIRGRHEIKCGNSAIANHYWGDGLKRAILPMMYVMIAIASWFQGSQSIV